MKAAEWKLPIQGTIKKANFHVQYSLTKYVLQPLKIIRHVRSSAELMEKKIKIPSENSVIFICGMLAASSRPKWDDDVQYK
jgi:hypothetical protein